MKFSDLKLHAVWVFEGEHSAKTAAAGVRKDNPREVARTFSRNVRAGGAKARVWVVVVRGRA